MRHALIVLALAALVLHGAAPARAGEAPRLPDVLPDPQGYWDSGSSCDRDASAPPPGNDRAAADEGDCWGFVPETFCGTGYGWQWFGLRQPNAVITFRAWSNLYNVPEPCPLTFTFDFGDGAGALAPGTSINSSTYVQVTHKYAQGGTYTVRITASNGYKSLSCTMVTITIFSCWQDGVLCYRGDNLVWNRPAGATFGVLDMDPPVSVNQVLMATGHSRIEYTYNDSGTCTRSMFKPTGETFVPLAGGAKTLFGSATSLDVNWDQGEMVPLPGSPTLYDFKLGGLPLMVAADLPLVVGTDSLTIQPYSWIGIPDVLDLCKMSGEILLPRDGEETVLKAAVVQGEITPSISFVNVTMKYDPKTGALDVKTAAKIPFSKWLVGESGYGLDAQWGFRPCGLNRAKVTIGGIKWNIPLGGYPPAWFVLNDFVGELDHVCDAEGFLIGLGGRGNLCVGPSFTGCVAVPGEFFRISDMMLAYQFPFRFILRGGTPQVLGYPVASARAVFNFGGHPLGMHVDGWMNVAGILQGSAGVGVSLTRLALLGQLDGSFQIPDFTCARTSYACRAIKSAVAWAAGGLPRKLSGVSATIDGDVEPAKMAINGAFRGMTSVGPLSLAFQVSVDESGAGLLLGTNYSNLIDLNPLTTVAALGAAAERGVPLAAGQRDVILGATSATATVPSLSLRTPAGATITPANAGSFPGVQHIANAPEATAAFLVAAPAAGTWTMSVDNLTSDQVTFTALAPQAPPAVTVTSATQAGETVNLTARVSPARSATAVTFLVSSAPSGGVIEPIGEPLPATSGTVSASWSTAELTSGAYYLGARADDGMNPPVTAFFAQPLVIDRGTLAPPTGLTGTRDGAAVTLTWTPSASAAAAGTTVLYTDRPALPGYPLADSGTTSAGITIGGLDPAKEYAFVAVAYDAEGNQSVPSAPWTTAAAAPPTGWALPPGTAIGDIADAGAMRQYFVRVPAGATSLTIATSGASADLALYLRRNAAPTAAAFDYRAMTAAWDESLAVTPSSAPVALAAGDWYVGVSAAAAATYTVTASVGEPAGCALWCDASVPATAAVDAEVTLTATPAVDGCGTAPSFDWDFGDGSPHSSAAGPHHSWTVDGVYSWLVTVSAGGRSCVSSGTITVGLGARRPVRRQLPGRPPQPAAP
jgi:PKD repeat protein